MGSNSGCKESIQSREGVLAGAQELGEEGWGHVAAAYHGDRGRARPKLLQGREGQRHETQRRQGGEQQRPDRQAPALQPTYPLM